jgi:hypothetical protein
VRVQVDQIDEDMLTGKCNKGYFFECSPEDLEQIIPLMGTKCQTVTVYGVEKDLIANIVLKHGLRGVDRIVNMGQALGIDVIWDGYDLISNLSRLVSY